MRNLITSFIATVACASALASPPIKIRQGMDYKIARKILISSGWQAVPGATTPNGTPICSRLVGVDPTDPYYKIASESGECKYIEIEDCSGSGMGFCMMRFSDDEGNILSVVTAGGPPPDAKVHHWKKEKSIH